MRKRKRPRSDNPIFAVHDAAQREHRSVMLRIPADGTVPETWTVAIAGNAEVLTAFGLQNAEDYLRCFEIESFDFIDGETGEVTEMELKPEQQLKPSVLRLVDSD